MANSFRRLADYLEAKFGGVSEAAAFIGFVILMIVLLWGLK